MNKMNPKSLFTTAVMPLLVIFTLVSCGKKRSTPLDDPTSGKIHITVDESYQPMMEAEIQVFESLYPHADITVTYANEVKAFEDLIADSSRLIVVNRGLNEQELNYFKEKVITPDITNIAFDGLAFITNNESKLKNLLYSQV